VNLADRIAGARASLRLPRRTVRLRLTVLYTGLFLAAGAGLLTITYLLERSAPSGKTANPLNALFDPLSPSLKSKSDQTQLTPTGVRPPSVQLKKQELAAELKAQALTTHTTDLHHLLTMSLIALAIMAVLAVMLGWLVSGRMLRPLRTMTTATQRISERNLHERLALPGPRDEMKDLADTIDGLLCRLQAAFDAQRRFVANASHELRTPLTVNRALLDVTLANPHATIEDLRTMGQDLIASGEQQEQLIEALLTLAASERGLERHEPFDLAEITADAILAPHPEINTLGLEVEATINPAPAIGDPRLAQRLVANLLDNAARHNVPGGHIEIATLTDSGDAVLMITNSGPIVPEADVDRLLQPFQRLRTDRAYEENGHGLGLSIVQSIATAHGATLSARPQDGGGLDIQVRFPPAPAASGDQTWPHSADT